jgi:copper chaperone CopZ
MKCGGCETNVTKALQAISGVHNVKACHQGKEVYIEFNPNMIEIDELIEAIEDAGFQVAEDE